eukprot:582537-Rhodomonas_salina.3
MSVLPAQAYRETRVLVGTGIPRFQDVLGYAATLLSVPRCGTCLGMEIRAFQYVSREEIRAFQYVSREEIRALLYVSREEIRAFQYESRKEIRVADS